MINTLKMQNSAVGKELIQTLSFRISQRRTSLTGALLYLHDPKAFIDAEDDEDAVLLFNNPSVPQIHKIIKSLIERLQIANAIQLTPEAEEAAHPELTSTNHLSEAARASEDTRSLQPLSMKEQLHLAIEGSVMMKQSTALSNNSLLSILKKEMSLFEGGGFRGRYLQLAYDYTANERKLRTCFFCGRCRS